MIKTKLGTEILNFLENIDYNIVFSWLGRDDEGEICYADKEININYQLILAEIVIFAYLRNKHPQIDPIKYDDYMDKIFDQLSDDDLIIISYKADRLMNNKEFLFSDTKSLTPECENILSFMDKIKIVDRWVNKKSRDLFKNFVLNVNIDIIFLEVFLYHWLLWKKFYDSKFKFSENDTKKIINKMNIGEIKKIAEKILDKIEQ
ncbi:hypothetical protein A2331_01070 [Candidatus Falkowbacteria bacterium RIFOXYB2_FULL_34_18]|uniref:Uncharacterized protein n=1 Tax=Candidatus Falkowbacteria bacterium RIFOXYD2_FULL_34_120 TaxID=1798007 RepID=A0A1F5TSP1_9BACT|nr:MAG: hypothetical protein A2331_01070 [Candidatus Falkowbacteria bacterium RIFOXYB2_FULL_34_18]OGF30162.1 MAG: hypothetical protein A2500_02040 [Candidatus Falkowbacteria bacterium RIFOXYC12_FULL_34_55]OGF37689.1 MAG: hypothetical protein A2466_05625 [Candidatus Falkowbacteria bacterium RIFOXYC2_FULL_34_220]OGF39416.1 MAG: hypothetical protein A2515_02855 [Candidatus Falkowbacteria bacterium RIFOXYD12_FULL_34_57]OGF41945.1 MAG: hypothetical protein A2531_04920 [Candidatus Falkowbacteria bact